VEDWETDSLTRSDVKAVTGRYPAVMGFELGGIEMGDKASLDSVDFGLIRKAALTHAQRGGIVTMSWHPRNPLTGGDAWDVSSDQVVKSLIEGGELHDLFNVWMVRMGDFLESLGDIPVIFRPWHENSGSWFWWGARLCTAQEYKDLFRATWTYLVKDRGLTNLVWCYSPNSGISPDEYMSRYPGDDIVDLLGVDHYEFVAPDGLEASGRRFADELQRSLSILQALGIGHDKPICLSETGLGIPARSDVVDQCPLSCHQGLSDRVCAHLAQRARPGEAFLRPLGGLRRRSRFQGFQRAGRHVFLNE
jgi:Beta-mannanase